jgi:ABC-type phosphate/phosphonate transport system permease subunit
MPAPKVYRDPQRGRILWIGIVIAVVVLAAIVLATVSLNRTMQSAGSFTGKIIAKEFTPAPAQEITVASRGNICSKWRRRTETAFSTSGSTGWSTRNTRWEMLIT